MSIYRVGSILIYFIISIGLTEAWGENVDVGAESPVPSQTHEYLIGPEDVLEVSVWKNAELSKVVIVRPDGMISLPLTGDIKAAGFTPNQLRTTITGKLKEYMETAVVSVIVQQVNSFRVFILGEVVKPGVYTLKSKTTLLQAIAIAGGFNQFASRNKIVIIREKIEDSAKTEKINIRFDDIVYSKDEDKNFVLMPSDTIFIP